MASAACCWCRRNPEGNFRRQRGSEEPTTPQLYLQGTRKVPFSFVLPHACPLPAQKLRSAHPRRGYPHKDMHAQPTRHPASSPTPPTTLPCLNPTSAQNRRGAMLCRRSLRPSLRNMPCSMPRPVTLEQLPTSRKQTRCQSAAHRQIPRPPMHIDYTINGSVPHSLLICWSAPRSGRAGRLMTWPVSRVCSPTAT